jgi:hypothetical protein
MIQAQTHCHSLLPICCISGGNIQGYLGWHGQTISMVDANGGITFFPEILVQVRLVRDDDSPWSDWINAAAIVKQYNPNVPRLSRVGIRHALYLAGQLLPSSLSDTEVQTRVLQPRMLRICCRLLRGYACQCRADC